MAIWNSGAKPLESDTDREVGHYPRQGRRPAGCKDGKAQGASWRVFWGDSRGSSLRGAAELELRSIRDDCAISIKIKGNRIVWDSKIKWTHLTTGFSACCRTMPGGRSPNWPASLVFRSPRWQTGTAHGGAQILSQPAARLRQAGLPDFRRGARIVSDTRPVPTPGHCARAATGGGNASAHRRGPPDYLPRGGPLGRGTAALVREAVPVWSIEYPRCSCPRRGSPRAVRSRQPRRRNRRPRKPPERRSRI